MTTRIRNPQSAIRNSVTRREIMRLSAAGVAGASLSGWFGLLANHARAAEPAKRTKNCILLWMNGGPSHLDTFDPKPGASTGGQFKSIRTRVPEIEISEHLPNLADQAHHLSIVRGMTSKEGNHQRAQYLMHTGYAPTGSVTHPSLGSWVSEELGNPNFDLPNF